jgi:uncharacterized Zn-binding protein involved in type VI secretion
MPAACKDDDICAGHGCFPPRMAGKENTSKTVFINGKQALRVGDVLKEHCCPLMGCHTAPLTDGSKTVRIEGRKAGRVKDPVGCGTKMASGSADVFIGG